jgi:hypothetical protein
MEISGRHPAYWILGREPPVPTKQDRGWAPELIWMLWRREISLTSAENQTQVFGCPAVVTILS